MLCIDLASISNALWAITFLLFWLVVLEVVKYLSR